MEASDAIKAVQAGRFSPFYVLYGKDRYRMEQFVELIKNKMFQPEDQNMGINKYDTQETSLDEIMMEADSAPFFMEKKLILVKDSVVFGTGKDNSKLEHRQEAILNYIEHPLESSVVVFIVNAEKLDERKKLVKSLKNRKVIIHFPELEPNQLLQWLKKRAGEQGRLLDPDGGELLIRRVGVSMQQLVQELDKLCLHVGERGEITRELVDQLIGVTVEEDVFLLVDAIVNVKLSDALAMYKALLIRKEEPIKLVALIVRQIRMMIHIKELEGHHYSPQQIAGMIGAHPYAVKLAAEKSKGYQKKRLAELLSSLADLDYGMKTGKVDKALGLELFILSLGSSYTLSFQSESFMMD
ncbi:DNA polymerase III subunit delta [Paenibacillus camelliae]|uniref:DNA polymerase III subunit delta n=1 Tax=Paenibacillus camelliae TaxID=512410 RepID=UPI00203BA292|nr:DNA polymerase III subunit delta [Paenibacillus camelliae]MCM3635475.1 DNA polymerase III subunit delta [Paenibacillus camelliae]